MKARDPFSQQFHESPGAALAAQCEVILRALPEWFGLEHALQEYVRDIAGLPTWLWLVDGQVRGFLSVRRHFPEAAEIHVMGVIPELHRTGVGRNLCLACEAHLKDQGVRFLQAKTLSHTKQNAAYAKTREFYTSQGFTPLEVFPTLWDEWNPCLVLVKALA